MSSKDRSISLARFLFEKGGLWLILGFLSVTAFSAYFSINLIRQLADDRSKLSQQWFTTSIENDILSGVDAITFEKCQLFFKDNTVLRLKISTQDRIICDLKKSELADTKPVVTNIYYGPHGQDIAGTVSINYDESSVSKLMQRLLIFSFLSILLIGLLMALLARKLQRSITLPIAIMAERFKEKLPQFTANEKMELSRSEIIEIRDILKSFLTTYERIEDYQKQEVKDAALRSVALLAQQVAHDIRSPLAALSSADKGLSELPEDSRLLIRSAVSRIKDIANQLISKTKWELKITGQQEDTAAVEASSPQFVALLVESIVSEKRLEFSERKEIAIETQLSDDAINLFILVDSIEFLRVLSNLINNGVDALTAAGRVSISVKENGSWVDIEIADNGKGIPVNVLNGLMVRGVTHGKSDGLGLGLYNARQCSEKWGGSLSIRSEIGKGTSINLKLPKATKPKWHLDTILIRPNATVVIVDDDPSIHEIWKSKLRRLRLKQTSCNELHFYTVEEFFNWYGNNKDVIKDKLFLIDYDFGGASMTGLEVIKKLNIYESSILVTSRFDQKDILESCLANGIPLLPKSLVGSIPLYFAK